MRGFKGTVVIVGLPLPKRPIWPNPYVIPPGLLLNVLSCGLADKCLIYLDTQSGACSQTFADISPR